MVSFIIPFPTQLSPTSGQCRRRCRRRILVPNSMRNIFCVADGAVFTQDVEDSRGRLSPKFPDRASGEWFGYEAAFSSHSGVALNIEERFVPDAYREWGVEIKGFDTVTSTQVTTGIYQKLTRALPSVGCEADAVTPDIFIYKYDNVFGFRDGSFCAGPFHLSEPCQWSFTLVDPQDSRSRARIEFGQTDYEDGEVGGTICRKGKITVFVEQKEADFCDGQVLPGCGGSGGFAAEGSMNLDELNGTWSILSETYAAKSSWRLLETNRTSTRGSGSFQEPISTALPRGLSLGIYRNSTSLNVVAGWQRGDLRVVLRRVYSAEGTLLFVSREIETRQE